VGGAGRVVDERMGVEMTPEFILRTFGSTTPGPKESESRGGATKACHTDRHTDRIGSGSDHGSVRRMGISIYTDIYVCMCLHSLCMCLYAYPDAGEGLATPHDGP
jgi:hypothetical protein